MDSEEDFGFSDGDEFEFADDDGFGFEEDGDGGGGDMEQMIHSGFRSAKSKLRDDGDFAGALEELLGVWELDGALEAPDRTKWGFKAAQQISLIYFQFGTEAPPGPKRTQFWEKADTFFRKSVDCIKVTKSLSLKEKNFLVAIDTLESHPNIDDLISYTNEALSARKMDAVRLKVLVRLAKLKLKRQLWSDFAACLTQCRDVCLGSHLFYSLDEVISLEIILASHNGDQDRVRELYEEFKKLSGLPTPEVNAIIRQAGGKLYMEDHNWAAAYRDFFEAFRSFSDRADPRAIDCLICVLVSIQLKSGPFVDPFSETNTKSYESNPQIAAMKELLATNQHADPIMFEKVIAREGSFLLSDPFLSGFVPHLRSRVRVNAVKKAVRPYSRITFSGLAEILGIPVEKIPHLLALLITKGEIQGSVDDSAQVLQLHREESEQDSRYRSLQEWSKNLDVLQTRLFRGFQQSGAPVGFSD